MSQSSASVATLAAALAKAQIELTNPEKSLVATLPAEQGRPERSFRYAPLSSGLEIVRKTLGRHEIATIQTTAVDRDSGTIRLTTTLAHASGEWIASEWPVCPLADLAIPRRMGAALTYARRYALFTLVGIAGEDDLDASDCPIGLSPQRPQPAARLTSPPNGNGISRPGNGGRRSAVPDHKILSPDRSADERDRLLQEIAALQSAEQAASWAKRALAIKNTLIEEHAGEIEMAFAGAMRRWAESSERSEGSENSKEPGEGATPLFATARSSEPTDANQPATSPADHHQPAGLTDAAVQRRMVVRSVRRRDKAHLKFVASQPCLVCGRKPSDPHHVRFAQPRALGAKVSDEFTVPLCRTHHREVHRNGNEARWWAALDRTIDPLKVANELWRRSHSDAS